MSITHGSLSAKPAPIRYLAFAVALSAMLAAAPAGAADFYAGKSIDLLIGAAPAAATTSMDAWSRAILRAISRGSRPSW